MAGCCHGFPYEGPFALYYPHSVLGLSPQQGYFPVQLLEGLINVIICLTLCVYEKKAKRGIDLLFAYLGMYAISRFFLEMLRGDAIRGVWNSISTSQIISLILLVISLVVLLVSKRTNTTEQ
jgi:phosphatidylglycerol:prolipoprotein diacylglycerol transferase